MWEDLRTYFKAQKLFIYPDMGVNLPSDDELANYLFDTSSVSLALSANTSL